MKTLGIPLAALVLAGCANTGRVIFVTTSSLGLNVDSKPPTASIAYDRIEGYYGPRYDNGALPPVVASIQTDGAIFNPKIIQVYATGAAAVKAVQSPGAPDGPHELQGSQGTSRQVFFGTTTTLGLKAGFSVEGPYPESFVFGYKRKEFSYIPLGSTRNASGQAIDVYPSVLGTIDTTANVQTQSGTSLKTSQFFATGWAAETLASHPNIAAVFKVKAQDAVSSALSADQLRRAEAAGKQARSTQDTLIDKVLAYVAPNGTVVPTRLAAVVDTANAGTPNAFPDRFKAFTAPDEIGDALRNDQQAALKLCNAVDALSSP